MFLGDLHRVALVMAVVERETENSVILRCIIFSVQNVQSSAQDATAFIQDDILQTNAICKAFLIKKKWCFLI